MFTRRQLRGEVSRTLPPASFPGLPLPPLRTVLTPVSCTVHIQPLAFPITIFWSLDFNMSFLKPLES